VKKIAADRNYRNYRKNAGLNDLWEYTKVVAEVLEWAASQSLHLLVPSTTIYQHGEHFAALFNRIKDEQGVPAAIRAVVADMMEKNLIGHKELARG